jgi:RES domain-containing protein
MEIFRITKEKYSKKLTASGKASRWNKDNQYVLYGGASRALASLENIVHFNSIEPTINYKTMIISFADVDKLITQIYIDDLPPNWREDVAYPALREIGSKWYLSNQSLILKVPSAVIIQEYNYIINIEHKDFKKNVKRVRTEVYFWDDRLFT